MKKEKARRTARTKRKEVRRMDEMVKIRSARCEDAEALVAIYRPYVEETAITFEYEVPSVELFVGRMRKVQEQFPFLVAEVDSELVGYAYVGAFKERAAYDWAVETSIYLKKGKRGLGIGRQLYDALEGILKLQGILNLNACIAYPEVEDAYLTRGSVAFHERLGFEWVGRFHKCGYKFDTWYDMVWMEKHIGEHHASPIQVRSFEVVQEEVSVMFGIE